MYTAKFIYDDAIADKSIHFTASAKIDFVLWSH